MLEKVAAAFKELLTQQLVSNHRLGIVLAGGCQFLILFVHCLFNSRDQLYILRKATIFIFKVSISLQGNIFYIIIIFIITFPPPYLKVNHIFLSSSCFKYVDFLIQFYYWDTWNNVGGKNCSKENFPNCSAFTSDDRAPHIVHADTFARRRQFEELKYTSTNTCQSFHCGCNISNVEKYLNCGSLKIIRRWFFSPRYFKAALADWYFRKHGVIPELFIWRENWIEGTYIC